MSTYHYEAINSNGESQEGNVDSNSAEALADSLQKKGLIVLSITDGLVAVKSASSSKAEKSKPAAARPRSVKSAEGKSGEELTGFAKANQWFDERFNTVSASTKVKLTNLLLFTSQLSSMVGAGLHLLKSLTSLAEDTADKKFQVILTNVREDVEGGEAFSNALAKYPKVFSTIYVNLVRAAEATGDMDVILGQLAIYLDKTLTLKRKVKGAMTYPVVILTFAFVAIILLIAIIIPNFERTFAKLGAELPLPTRVLIMISDIVRNYSLVAILVIGAIVFIFWRLVNTEKGSFLWDSWIIKLPLFGQLIWKSVLTRFLRTLSILLESGVTVIEALELSGLSSGNKMLEKASRDCVDDIKDGHTIHEALAARGIFPDMVIRMVSSGEEAGTLPEMLRKTTVYFEQQVETAVESLSSLIEPVLIVILGTVVGAIIISIFLPIFKLGDAVKKGMK